MSSSLDLAIAASSADHVLGPAGAHATVVEYGDFECPTWQAGRARREVAAAAATHLEAQLCTDEEVIVVGGGNSAGQAAVFLGGQCRQVHVLVRSSGLAESMSQYLIRRIEDSRNITLHPWTEIASLDGDTHLKQVTWRTAGDEKTHVL